MNPIFYANIRELTRYSIFSVKPYKLFAVKVGLATAAVYYIKEQKVWKNSNESVQNYEKLKESVKPYVQEVKSQIPVELPELPRTDGLVSLAKKSWNIGVLASFKFLSELPETVDAWTKKGIDKALENEGIRDFVQSFSLKNSNVQPIVDVAKK